MGWQPGSIASAASFLPEEGRGGFAAGNGTSIGMSTSTSATIGIGITISTRSAYAPGQA
jgi:hypothetical protein